SLSFNPGIMGARFTPVGISLSAKACIVFKRISGDEVLGSIFLARVLSRVVIEIVTVARLFAANSFKISIYLCISALFVITATGLPYSRHTCKAFLVN